VSKPQEPPLREVVRSVSLERLDQILKYWGVPD